MKKADWLLGGYTLLVIIFLLLPIFIVVPISFSVAKTLQFPPKALTLYWYQTYFSSSEWLNATNVSINLAVSASLITLLTATAASFALVRYKFHGSGLVRGYFLLPWVAPHVVVATGAYMFLFRSGLGLSRWALMFEHAVIAFPIAVLIISAGLERVDRDTEDAALTLGASRLTTWRSVIVPAILPPIIAASLLVFIISWDEVIFAWFLSSTTGPTLPGKIFSYLRYGSSPLPAAISTFLLGITLTLVMIGLLGWRTIERKGSLKGE
jgi:ABC-type spermidine/putrescine transport system permease subunit II